MEIGKSSSGGGRGVCREANQHTEYQYVDRQARRHVTSCTFIPFHVMVCLRSELEAPSFFCTFDHPV